jgi:hypothetical protein
MVRTKRLFFRSLLLCASLLLIAPRSFAADAPVAQQKQPGDAITVEADINFMLRFEQAVREDDKQWIAHNSRSPFSLIINGKLRRFETQSSIIRHFDEIYLPPVKRAVLTAELADIRSNNGLLMVPGESPPTVLITVLPLCEPEPVGCAKETYLINSITYYFQVTPSAISQSP